MEDEIKIGDLVKVCVDASLVFTVTQRKFIISKWGNFAFGVVIDADPVTVKIDFGVDFPGNDHGNTWWVYRKEVKRGDIGPVCDL